MPLYQMTTEAPPGQTRDEIHKSMERRFKTPTKDQERDYLWGYDGQNIAIRRRSFIDEKQTKMEVPKTGATIRFELSVSPKKGGAKRRAIIAQHELDEWIDHQCAGAGLFLSEHTAQNRGSCIIANANVWELNEVTFQGRAVVTDSERLEDVLLKGIPTLGKCWGFGFLHVYKVGSRKP